MVEIELLTNIILGNDRRPVTVWTYDMNIKYKYKIDNFLLQYDYDGISCLVLYLFLM